MGKVGRRNFGEFMVIYQIRERFPPPKFPSIQYYNYVLHGSCMYSVAMQANFGSGT